MDKSVLHIQSEDECSDLSASIEDEDEGVVVVAVHLKARF